jgi:hypothetical protein
MPGGCKQNTQYDELTRLSPSGIQPDPSKKEYCSHWIQTGECAFTAIGCRYKHEMPPLEKLREIGFKYIPTWFRHKTAIVSKDLTWPQQRLGNKKSDLGEETEARISGENAAAAGQTVHGTDGDQDTAFMGGKAKEPPVLPRTTQAQSKTSGLIDIEQPHPTNHNVQGTGQGQDPCLVGEKTEELQVQLPTAQALSMIPDFIDFEEPDSAPTINPKPSVHSSVVEPADAPSSLSPPSSGPSQSSTQETKDNQNDKSSVRPLRQTSSRSSDIALEASEKLPKHRRHPKKGSQQLRMPIKSATSISGSTRKEGLAKSKYAPAKKELKNRQHPPAPASDKVTEPGVI